jgi:hypothetical protein
MSDGIGNFSVPSVDGLLPRIVRLEDMFDSRNRPYMVLTIWNDHGGSIRVGADMSQREQVYASLNAQGFTAIDNHGDMYARFDKPTISIANQDS